jgi:hypothetical protein
MLFAAVKPFAEGLSLKTLLTIPNLLSGYTETSSIHTRTAVNFVLENVNRKQW